MTTLSTTAKQYNAEGYLERSGLTVTEHPQTASTCATICIDGAELPRHELEVKDGAIESPAFGWRVVL